MSNERVTLADALSNVEILDERPLPDEQPYDIYLISIIY